MTAMPGRSAARGHFFESAARAARALRTCVAGACLAVLSVEKAREHLGVRVVGSAPEILNDCGGDLRCLLGRSAESTLEKGGQDLRVLVVRGATKVGDYCFRGLSRSLEIHGFSSLPIQRDCRFCRLLWSGATLTRGVAGQPGLTDARG